ncbi:carboxypeptidase A2-like [Watersipora subatra]|uniref:carboxypeptidase A2-like n=1 Tax=Watersipora subatra TaxID=2589382 RepID=UPI00355C57E1
MVVFDNPDIQYSEIWLSLADKLEYIIQADKLEYIIRADKLEYIIRADKLEYIIQADKLEYIIQADKLEYIIQADKLEYIIQADKLEYIIQADKLEYIIRADKLEYIIQADKLEYIIRADKLEYIIQADKLEYIIQADKLEYIIQADKLEYIIQADKLEYIIQADKLEYIIQVDKLEYIIQAGKLEYIIQVDKLEYIIRADKLEYIIQADKLEYIIQADKLEYIIRADKLEYIIRADKLEYIIRADKLEYIIRADKLEYIIQADKLEYIIQADKLEYIIRADKLEYIIRADKLEYIIQADKLEYIIWADKLEYIIQADKLEYIIQADKLEYIIQADKLEWHRLLRVVPTTTRQVDTLSKLESDFQEIDFWTEPHIGRPCDLNIPSGLVGYVTRLFTRFGMVPETIHKDLQKLINRNKATPRERRLFSQAGNFNNIVGLFARHNEIEEWLYQVANAFPSLAKVESIGNTYEGRQQTLIKIGAADSKGDQKPIIWIDSGIHAREWLTVGTTVWIINKMLTTYNTDPEVKDLMDHYDWYFLPVANPDGYEYTHTSDRLWRKTRTPNSWSSCRGTDPNRNWDYQWGVSGTSSSPCSSTYGGSAAFSEPCTQNMRDAILSIAPRVKLYMGVHSYSQMWLTPWAWGGNKPSDYSDLLNIANRGNAALRAVHGTRFVVGTPPDILYSASGGAYDWAKGVAGIKYSYTYELRPDGNSYNGFVVPESEIEPSGEEVWASLAQVATDLK